jgi:hypothetical protein
MALIYRWFRFFLSSIALYASTAVACALPVESFDNAEPFPQRVRERFCNPEAGYTSLLMIQAAVSGDSPVFRVIAVRRDGSDHVERLRLYQFDKEGNDHPEVGGEPQAVIEFKGSSPKFEARVKGLRTTISFVEHIFEFDMHGIFGLRIKQHLNSEGRITIGGRPASVLLISTTNKDHWRWVLDDGEMVHF